MEKEAAPLIAAGEFSRREIFSKSVYDGVCFKEKVTVVISGVGKANAAAGVQIALFLGAKEIINFGFAGGLHKGLEVGGIYSVTSAVQYDYDLTQLNGKPVGTLDGRDTNFLPIDTPTIFAPARLGTGDRFNDSPVDHELLLSLGADVRDMEGGAMAQICLQCGVPFRSYKIVSDVYGSGSTTEQYLKNIALCTETIRRELPKIINA